MAVRGIHPTYYGRICPIETPEGQNAGLVNSVTIYARLNLLGFLETPFLKVCQSQVQTTMTPKFLCAEKEELVKIAPGDLQYSTLSFLHKTLVPMKLADEFGKRLPTQIEYIGLSPLQMISIGTSLIPFLEHDDANRALMGSNMQRQALPLMIPERAIVGTGLEARVIADSGYITQAKNSGYVAYISGDTIVIQSASFL
jgi:DNA-directed RNA polymerase subunit beta